MYEISPKLSTYFRYGIDDQMYYNRKSISRSTQLAIVNGSEFLGNPASLNLSINAKSNQKAFKQLSNASHCFTYTSMSM